MKSVKALIITVVMIAGLLYTYSIVQAGINTLKHLPYLPEFLVTAVAIIGGTLATNFGAVLGITFTPANNRMNGNQTKGPTFLGLRTTFDSQNDSTKADENGSPTTPGKVQIIAAWVYFIGLLIALIIYLIALITHTEDKFVDPVIIQQGKTFLGVAAGALTVYLGTPK